MSYFAIIEVDDGLTVVELEPNQTAEDAALKYKGALIDAGPYMSYDDALDALAEFELEREGD